jgi:hypothetical protein
MFNNRLMTPIWDAKDAADHAGAIEKITISSCDDTHVAPATRRLDNFLNWRRERSKRHQRRK